MILCKPFKCLSFLGGRKAPHPQDYNPVDAQGGSRGPNVIDDDDADDFFDDDWGTDGKEPAVATTQGVERNPTRETTTKRASGGASSSSSASTAASAPAPKASAKKDVDFFSEMGMEPEYKAPRTRASSSAEAPKVARSKSAAKAAASAPGPSVNELLGDDHGAIASAGGAWGDDDDLDLGL